MLAAVEQDTTAKLVTLQRFSASGPVSADLQLSGYSMPTIATDGRRAWVVMVRAADGYVVSRAFAPETGWSQEDRVEIGAEGARNHAWPNLLARTDGRLRFIVRGPSGGVKQTAVLAFQRPL